MSFTPDNALVWGEIPVRDLDRGMAFYATVFGYDLKTSMRATPGTTLNSLRIFLT